MALYTNVVQRAWTITKTYRHLWLFGFFAALFSTGSGYDLLVRGFLDIRTTIINTQGQLADFRDITLTVVSNPTTLFAPGMLPITIILLLILTLGVVLVWFIVISQITLIKDTARLDDKKGLLNLGEIIKASHGHLWQVLGAYIVGRWFIMLVFILLELTLGITYLATNSSTWGMIFTVITLVVTIPLAIITSIVVRYAIIYIILEDKGFIGALKAGVKLFGRYWLISFETIAVIAIATLVAGIIVIFAPLLLAAPFYISSAVWGDAVTIAWVFYDLSFIVGIISFFIVGILALAILSTFSTAIWTILFKELSKSEGHQSIIVRALRQVPGLAK